MRFLSIFGLLSGISYTFASSQPLSPRDIFAARMALTGKQLPRDQLESTLIEIIDWYNQMVRGEQKLNEVTDPYVLTLYTVLCELSLNGPYNLEHECEALEISKEVMDQLVDLMSKAHGHGGENEVDLRFTSSQDSQVHETYGLNERQSDSMERFDPNFLDKFNKRENLVSDSDRKIGSSSSSIQQSELSNDNISSEGFALPQTGGNGIFDKNLWHKFESQQRSQTNKQTNQNTRDVLDPSLHDLFSTKTVTSREQLHEEIVPPRLEYANGGIAAFQVIKNPMEDPQGTNVSSQDTQ